MNKVFTYIKSILLPVLIGVIVGLITSKYMNNDDLIQPRLAPPAILFPIVWTILYTLMGVSYGILKTNNLTNSKIDFVYYLQLAINALWSIIFFIFKWRFFAYIWIILLAAFVIIMIKKFYDANKLSGILQIPYILWIIFASYLNLSIYLLNR